MRPSWNPGLLRLAAPAGLAWALAAPTIVGCASAAPVEGPEATVAAYVAAVRAGDAAAVHALLDEETRQRVSVEEVAASLEANREELGEQLARIEDAEPARARARLPVGDDDAVVFSLEEGRWHIRGGVYDAPSLDTPRGAVLALRRALIRGGLESITRVLSRETRADLEAEIQRFLDDTADVLDLEVEERGNEAIVRTTSGKAIRLVRESAEWHVVEIERW